MDIALFGATGKLGRELISYIGRKDPSIRIHAVGHRKDNVFEGSDNVVYHSLDVTVRDGFSRLPAAVDAVINMAAAVTTRVNSSDVRTYVDTNVCGAVNILDYAVKANAERIVYSQTYNDVFGGPDVAETVIHPDSPRRRHYAGEAALYAITKNCAVDLQDYYAERSGVRSFVLRLPTVYCYSKDPYYLVGGQRRMRPFPKMIRQAMEGETIEIWGDPGRLMDMVYAEDCSQMFYRTLVSDCSGGVFNVGTGVGTSLLQQVNGMIEVFSEGERRSEIVFCPEKPSGPSYIMDIENAERELGYRPQYMYMDMLKAFKEKMLQDNAHS